MKHEHEEHHELEEVLDTLEQTAEKGSDERISFGEIVDGMGDRSFAALLLVPALIMVSPVSGIPGSPTVMAMVVGLVAIQMLAGRKAVWLPAFLRGMSVRRERFSRAVHFLRKPVGWVDPLVRERLTFLTDRPASFVALLVCLILATLVPPMEFLPLLASLSFTVIALIATGLLARDGLFVLAGYLMLAGLVAGGLQLA